MYLTNVATSLQSNFFTCKHFSSNEWKCSTTAIIQFISLLWKWHWKK